MSDLTDLYKMQFEAFPQARAAAEESGMRQLAMEKARDELEAQRGLRQLYANQQGMPSISQVGAVAPGMVPDYLKSQYEGQLHSAQLNEMQMKQNATVFGPISDKYAFMRKLNIPGWENGFKQEMGKAARSIVEGGGQLPMNFNPDEHDLDSVLGTSVMLGYPSQYMKMLEAEMQNTMGVQKEQAIRNLPGVHTDPTTGITFQTPGVSQAAPAVQPTARPMPMGSATAPAPEEATNEVITSPEGFAAAKGQMPQDEYAQIVPPPKQTGNVIVDNRNLMEWEKGRLNYLTEKAKQTQSVATEGAKKAATLEAETAEATAQKANILGAMPSDDEVIDLIKKSVSGNIEKQIKSSGASEQLGIGTQANTASAELKVLQEQLRAIVKSLYTPGAITDAEQKSMIAATGEIAAAKDADSRIKAYKKFMETARKSITSHPELASEVEKITGTKILSPRRALNVGDIVGNMQYIGGHPNSKTSWKEVK